MCLLRKGKSQGTVRCAVVKSHFGPNPQFELQSRYTSEEPPAPPGSAAASAAEGECGEATGSHQLSSTAAASPHTTEGNGHEVSLRAKFLHFKCRKRKISTVYGGGGGERKYLLSLTKLERVQSYQLARKGNPLPILPCYTTLLYKADKKNEVLHVHVMS